MPEKNKYGERKKKLGSKVELGVFAKDNYKARLTKGLFDVTQGEGYIIEVVNFRSKRVLRKELFDNLDEARKELRRIRSDIAVLETEEFRRKYLNPA